MSSVKDILGVRSLVQWEAVLPRFVVLSVEGGTTDIPVVTAECERKMTMIKCERSCFSAPNATFLLLNNFSNLPLNTDKYRETLCCGLEMLLCLHSEIDNALTTDVQRIKLYSYKYNETNVVLFTTTFFFYLLIYD